jgi:hypothetical protein
MSSGNDETKEFRINNLKKTQEQRKQDSKNRVYQAIERLQKLNAKINFHTIAREAQVSVSYLYKYPELKQHIGELRSKQNSLPVSPVAKPNSTSHGKVVTRLQERIKKLEAENKELKKKCEALAGQVYRVHHLESQAERLQEQNEDLRSKLGEQEIARKVTPIDTKRKTKSVISESIQEDADALRPSQASDVKSEDADLPVGASRVVRSELDELGISLNPTLSKTIKAATEETVLAAIEALKDQLNKQDIPNPGGWLNKAIKEAWTKAEPISTPPKTTPQSKIVTATDKPNKKLMSSDQLKKLSNLFNNQDD